MSITDIHEKLAQTLAVRRLYQSSKTYEALLELARDSVQADYKKHSGVRLEYRPELGIADVVVGMQLTMKMNTFKRYTAILAAVTGMAIVTIPVKTVAAPEDEPLHSMHAHSIQLLQTGTAFTRLVDFDAYCYIQGNAVDKVNLLCMTDMGKYAYSIQFHREMVALMLANDPQVGNHMATYTPFDDGSSKLIAHMMLITADTDAHVLFKLDMQCAVKSTAPASEDQGGLGLARTTT